MNQINSKYYEKLEDYTFIRFNKVFNEDEFKKNLKFDKNQLIEALRKFICRYLVSSDCSNNIDPEISLLPYLSKMELWTKRSENNFKQQIEESLLYLEDFFVEPIKVKHSINLFNILINGGNYNNGQIKRTKDSNKAMSNIYINNINNFNREFKIPEYIISQTIDIIYKKDTKDDAYDALINFMEDPKHLIEFKGLIMHQLNISCSGNHYCLTKFENNKIIASFRRSYPMLFIYDRKNFRKTQKLELVNIDGIEKIDGANNVNSHYILKDNTIILCCLIPKIIRIKIEYNKAELIQVLDGNNYCSEFYNCFEFNDTLVSSTDKGIIIWDKKDNLYNFKLNISIENPTNIVFINENLFAANDIGKKDLIFYDYNFKEISRIGNIQTGIEPLRMTMISKKILAICSTQNSSIYLIDTENKKLIKEVIINGYNSQYYCISSLLDSTIIVNDSSDRCLHLELENKDNDYNFKIINELGNLCANTYTFVYLYDEVFINCCVNGHFFAYFREYAQEKYNELLLENNKELNYHTSGVKNILILNDGRLASCSDDNSIIIYNNLVSCSNDNTIKIMEFITPNEIKVIQTLTEHSNKVTKVISWKNNSLISVSDDNYIKIWEFKNNSYSLVRNISISCGGSYHNILLTKPNEVVCSSYSANHVQFYNCDNESCISSHSSKVCSLTSNCMCLIKNEILLVGGYNSSYGIYIFNINSHNYITNISGFSFVDSIILLSDESLLIGGNYNGYKIYHYNYNYSSNKLEEINSKNVHNGHIYQLIETEDNSIISCSADNKIKFYD